MKTVKEMTDLDLVMNANRLASGGRLDVETQADNDLVLEMRFELERRHLRDRLAMAALTGLLSTAQYEYEFKAAALSLKSYEIADDMLVAREPYKEPNKK